MTSTITVSYGGMLAPPPVAPTRAAILRLQEALLPVQCEMPEPVHHFARGMYGRELTLPAGAVVVGKIHKHEHLLMVLKGRATVVSEFGRQEVLAGWISVSLPGTKRAVYSHEDTTFVTVHLNPTDTHDLHAVEAEHIEPESADVQALFAKYIEGALT